MHCTFPYSTFLITVFIVISCSCAAWAGYQPSSDWTTSGFGKMQSKHTHSLRKNSLSSGRDGPGAHGVKYLTWIDVNVKSTSCSPQVRSLMQGDAIYRFFKIVSLLYIAVIMHIGSISLTWHHAKSSLCREEYGGTLRGSSRSRAAPWRKAIQEPRLAMHR